jgi:hypothetical protein
MIDIIKDKKYIFGYIIRHSKKNGVNFLTPPDLTHQIGSLNHKKNHTIIPHLKIKKKGKVNHTSEVLIIQKGKLRLDIYSNKKKYLFSKIIKKDDILIIIKGGRGFKVLEPCSIIEVKQGPYNKMQDKIRFDSVDPKKIKIKK